MRRLIGSLGLVAALVPLPAGADTWRHDYPVTGKPHLVVRSDDGSIQITPGNAGEVSISVHTVGWRLHRREVQVDVSQRGNTITLEVRKPRRLFEIYFSMRSIRTEVRVPREVDLDLESGDGSISIESVKGSVVAVTGDGSIRARDVSGAIRLRTGDGSIIGERIDGTLVASTGDGPVRIGGRFDSLELKSGDGSVEAEANTGSRMGAGWSLSTSDGSLALIIPKGLAADLDAHTGDGRIDADLPVTVEGRFSRRTLRGEINGGGPPLRLRSGDGSIRIERTP